MKVLSPSPETLNRLTGLPLSEMITTAPPLLRMVRRQMPCTDTGPIEHPPMPLQDDFCKPGAGRVPCAATGSTSAINNAHETAVIRPRERTMLNT